MSERYRLPGRASLVGMSAEASPRNTPELNRRSLDVTNRLYRVPSRASNTSTPSPKPSPKVRRNTKLSAQAQLVSNRLSVGKYKGPTSYGSVDTRTETTPTKGLEDVEPRRVLFASPSPRSKGEGTRIPQPNWQALQSSPIKARPVTGTKIPLAPTLRLVDE